MRREGLEIDSSTLWEQTERLARVLGSTADAVRAYVVTAPVVHADETPWYMRCIGVQAAGDRHRPRSRVCCPASLGARTRE
jgi:hypothetical protein